MNQKRRTCSECHKKFDPLWAYHQSLASSEAADSEDPPTEDDMMDECEACVVGDFSEFEIDSEDQELLDMPEEHEGEEP
jgi:hypothetical protein